LQDNDGNLKHLFKLKTIFSISKKYFGRMLKGDKNGTCALALPWAKACGEHCKM
jgi:hypothetical protein